MKKLILSFVLSACACFVLSNEAHALMLQPSQPFSEEEEENDSITYTYGKFVDEDFVQPDTDAADFALQLAVGKRYVWGGNSNTEVDCSAFTQQFLREFKGINISRTTYDQVREGTRVENPEPGDLVFFNDFAHVGVYVGDGMMVDALNPDEGVGLRAVSYVHGKVDGYYRY